MAKSNNVRPIPGLKPQKPKKIHYLFAFGTEDFASFTGSSPYLIKQPESVKKHVYGCVTDQYLYIYCDRPEDIQGLVKIEASFTDKFKEKVSSKILSEIKAEIQICNFVSSQHFNPEYIPNVLKEVMAEHVNPGSSFCFPVVGMVVISRRDYPPINVSKGDIGIIVSLYGNEQRDADIIFSNGGHCGFSYQEILEDIQFSHVSKHPLIKNYQYKNLKTLFEDFEEGNFDVEFYKLEE